MRTPIVVCPPITAKNDAMNNMSTATAKTTVKPPNPTEYDGDDLFGGLHHAVKTSNQSDTQPKNKNAPLPVLAFATHFTENCVPKRNSKDDTGNTEAQLAKLNLLRAILPLHTLTITVPPYRRDGEPLDPLYHSIEGQDIYVVDWHLQFPGIQLTCLDATCKGSLVAERTNLSKNRRLFPIFKMNGPPGWAIVQSYSCPLCKIRATGNDARLLLSLPEYARNQYPVDMKYAFAGSTFHLSRGVTDVVEELMPTYGNGDLLARMIKKAIDQDYMRRLQSYLSYWKIYHETNGDDAIGTPKYPERETEFVSFYPPTGETIREIYNKAKNSVYTSYGISDHERFTQEIQSVTTDRLFAQDHTMEVVKNYSKCDIPGAFAVWDACTETGEIATAVMVGSTKTRDLAHAAEQLARRKGFNPTAMYSNTWPNNEPFWKLVFGNQLEGRLGLFHFLQRIIRTMRQRHVDYHRAIQKLGMAVYRWDDSTFATLVTALKNGEIGSTRYTEDEISDMMDTPLFKRQYNKYLMKVFHPPETIALKLKAWHCRYKVTSSNQNEAPAMGRIDPTSKKPLFTEETRDTLQLQMKNAAYIVDPLPLDMMYRKIEPPATSKHGLPEYISLRAESKLEGFHNPLSNFGNTNMRRGLADNLNLEGTSRYNVTIRHRLTESSIPPDKKNDIPGYWRNYPSYFNHCELKHTNDLAKAAKYPDIPFQYVRSLPDDNGERFFSEYWLEEKERQKKIPRHPLNDRCPCEWCALGPIEEMELNDEDGSEILETLDLSHNKLEEGPSIMETDDKPLEAEEA